MLRCRPHAPDKAIQLEKQFGELVFGRGLAANGKRMIELFVSEKGTNLPKENDHD